MSDPSPNPSPSPLVSVVISLSILDQVRELAKSQNARCVLIIRQRSIDSLVDEADEVRYRLNPRNVLHYGKLHQFLISAKAQFKDASVPLSEWKKLAISTGYDFVETRLTNERENPKLNAGKFFPYLLRERSDTGDEACFRLHPNFFRSQ